MAEHAECSESDGECDHQVLIVLMCSLVFSLNRFDLKN